MPQTKEIDPYRNPTKEISLGEILRMHGVPSAEQESLQEPSIANELVQKYVDDQLTKRGYSPAFVKAADAGVKAMIIAAPVAGLANRMVMPEAFSTAQTAASVPSQAPRLTELLQGGGHTAGLEPHSPVPYHADYMGSTRPIRWNDLPNRLGYEPPPLPPQSRGAVLRFNTPDDVYAHLDAEDALPTRPRRYAEGGAEVQRMPWETDEEFEEFNRGRTPLASDPAQRPLTTEDVMGTRDPAVGIYNRMDRGTSVAERAEAQRVAQAERQRFLSGGRPPMRQPYDYPSEDYRWNVRDRVRRQQAAPVRSLPPYDQPGNRFYGNNPTEHIGNYGRTGTGQLKAGGSRVGAPTGMFDSPSPLEFRGQSMGQTYTDRAAMSIPGKMRKPGLVVYQEPDNPRIHYAYFDKDGRALAGASAYRDHRGTVHVGSFGGDMTKGIAGKKAAAEVGMALLRSGPVSGGAMSQYSRGLFARIAEAAANPKIRAAYYKTRLLDPNFVKFEK